MWNVVGNCLPDKHVIGNVVQVSTVFEPRSGGGNVIGGALAFDFDKNDHVFEIFAVPLVEGCEQLQTVRFRIDVHGQLTAVRYGRLVSVLAGVEAFGGQLISEGRGQFEFLTVRTLQ